MGACHGHPGQLDKQARFCGKLETCAFSKKEMEREAHLATLSCKLPPCSLACERCENDKAKARKQRDLLDNVEGGWFRKKDGKPVGEILEGRLIWNRKWGFDEAYASLYEDDTETLSLQINGMHFIGQVCLEAQATIEWSDGDVWIRK